MLLVEQIKKIGIVTNPLRDADFSKTAKMVELLERNGLTAVLPKDFARSAPEGVYTADAEMMAGVDMILTLGGDGTILSVAEQAAKANKPAMGINIGHLGYLTDNPFELAEKSIKMLCGGYFARERRMMLKAVVVSGEREVREQSVLNDVCVTRGAATKIIRFDLYINGNFVDNYNADGIIVSTPTGSTAYNLSAGGPILIPNAEMIAITPICPHMLTTRPFVVSSDDKITIRICSETKETVVSMDGVSPLVVEKGDIIDIERSEYSLELLKTNGLDFYDILRKKLIVVSPVDA